MNPLGQPAPDRVAVREKIVEDRDDGSADIAILAQGQRERYRKCILP